MQGEKECGFDGISTMKNIFKKSEKHLLGKICIENSISEGRWLAAQKHHEQVSVNRWILTGIVHVVCFLGNQ